MDIRSYDLSIKIDTKIDTSEKKIDTTFYEIIVVIEKLL